LEEGEGGGGGQQGEVSSKNRKPRPIPPVAKRAVTSTVRARPVQSQISPHTGWAITMTMGPMDTKVPI